MATVVQTIAFAGTMGLGAMAPGPDFAIVVRQAVTGGRQSGMATAFGIATGVLVWVTAAALGVAALLAASATAFTVVKIVGACYLFYLGIRSLIAARKNGGAVATTDEQGTGGRWGAFRQGLLCNVLNPKAAVFFVALIPQFVGDNPALTETMLLSVVAALVSAVWFTLVANVVGALRRVFSRERVRRTIDGLTGTALIALGLRLAVGRT